MDFKEKFRVKLDELDLVTMNRYLEQPGQCHKLVWDVNHHDNAYHEVEILPGLTNEDDYKLTKCYVCNIDIPITLKNQHERSNKHAMNMKIINISLKRMMNHNENTSREHQTNSIKFCDICSNIKTTDDHNSTLQHKMSIKQDLLMKYLLSLYEGTKKITEIITDIKENIIKDFFKDNTCTAEVQQSNDPLEIYFRKIKIPNAYVRVVNDSTLRIETDNSTLDCHIDHFLGVNPVRGILQCFVCRAVVGDLKDHLNSNMHIAKVSAELVNCCIRKIDEQFHHCILCNKIVSDVNYHSQLDSEHMALIEKNYRSIWARPEILANANDNTNDNCKTNIQGHSYDSKLANFNNYCDDDIINKDGYLYCTLCNVHILSMGDDNAAYIHANSESHKRIVDVKNNFNFIISYNKSNVTYNVTFDDIDTKFQGKAFIEEESKFEDNDSKNINNAIKLNNGDTKNDNSKEVNKITSADNSKVENDIGRSFYEDFFEYRHNKAFCHLCKTHENNTFIHKNKSYHIRRYMKFLGKYNILIDKNKHYCKKCKTYVESNLAEHVIKYHDKELFVDKVTYTSNKTSASTKTLCWCKPCDKLIEKQYDHKKTDDHKDKLREFFQKHSICKKTDVNTKKKKNKTYCQACNVFLKQSKIYVHTDSPRHNSKLKTYSAKASDSHKVSDSVTVTCDDKSKTVEQNFGWDSSDSSEDSLESFTSAKQVDAQCFENKSLQKYYSTMNATSSQLSEACCDNDDDDENCPSPDLLFDTQWSNKQQNDDHIPPANDAPINLIGTWKQPLHKTVTNIYQIVKNSGSKITQFDVEIENNYCGVCRANIIKNASVHKKEKRHIMNLDKIIADNKICFDGRDLFCGICLVNIKDLLDHVTKDSRHKELVVLKEVQESYCGKLDELEWCFEATDNIKYLICKYCNTKVFSREDLRKVHIEGAKHKQQKDDKMNKNYIRKYDNKYHCSLCLEEFNFGKILNHLGDMNHKNQYETISTVEDILLKLNNIVIFEDKLFCLNCDEVILNTVQEVLAHVESKKHDYVTGDGVGVGPNNVLADDEGEQDPNTLKDSKLKDKMVENTRKNNEIIQNIHENEVIDSLLYCDVCTKQFEDDTSYERHTFGKQHKNNVEKIMEINSIKIMNDLTCYCKLCHLFITKVTVMKHVRDIGHREVFVNYLRADASRHRMNKISDQGGR